MHISWVLKYIFMSVILWRVSPMRELLKRGASKQARNRRRTSVYSSLLCNARKRRKSSHASPSSLVRDVVSTALEKNGEILLGCSGRNSLKEGAVWHVSPMRELLKRGASKQARNRRRTSDYSSLLCHARNRRPSSHASPTSHVATQHRSCGILLPCNNSSRVSFSVRSALTNSTTEFSVLSAPRL
jgi:hypothetical protein